MHLFLEPLLPVSLILFGEHLAPKDVHENWPPQECPSGPLPRGVPLAVGMAQFEMQRDRPL